MGNWSCCCRVRLTKKEISNMQKPISFISDGLKISGTLTLPRGQPPQEGYSAFIVLHGFGSNQNAGNVIKPSNFLNEMGYATLRFDMRGCGQSQGERGRLICLEQVVDTQSACTFLESIKEIDRNNIALIGSSFGAAVALYAGSIDSRFSAIISSGGWGNGKIKFEGQHKSSIQRKKFETLLKTSAEHKKANGAPMQISRYDIVPIPNKLRGHLAPGSLLEFSSDTLHSMYQFNAEEIVHMISPRPLLLMHSADDSVTPTEQSLRIYERAHHPKDLHLFAETDHFMFDEQNSRVRELVAAWLQKFFPLNSDRSSA